MLFNVPHIHRPDLLPEPGLKWHLQLWTRRRRRLFLDAIEFVIEGQEPSTGRLGEMDADLLQGSSHAVRPQLRRILHQLPHLIDFARARFARVPLRNIFEALVAEQGPSFEHFIHPVARCLQVGADCRIGPSLRVQMMLSANFAAFPDMQATIEDQIAEGDMVVTRWTARGTHQGELMGIPPSGIAVAVTAIVIDRIVGGKIAETWTSYDALGLLQQIGAVPAMG
jgi:predicted ester cyclase